MRSLLPYNAPSVTPGLRPLLGERIPSGSLRLCSFLKESLKPTHDFLRLPKLALPHYQYPPAKFAQVPSDAQVPYLVAGDLLPPERNVGRRQCGASTAAMGMPE